MPLTDLTIVTRSLRARLFSTVTTVLMVAVAVALMLVILSARDAGRRAFERGSGTMHLLVSRDPSPLVSLLNSVFYADAPKAVIEWERAQRLVTSYPFEWTVPVAHGDSYRGYPVAGTTPDFFARFSPASGERWRFRAAAGDSAPADGASLLAKDFEAVVGSAAARATNLAVGDTIYLTHGTGGSRQGSGGAEDGHADHVHGEFPVRIAAILEPSATPHDRALFVSLNTTWILHAHDRRLREDPNAAITTAADLIDADRKITALYLRVKSRPGASDDAANAAVNTIAAQLRAQVDITVASPAGEVQNLFRIVSYVDQILIAMAAVVALSSALAITLAIYNSMEQRRRQIAVLRVLGASRPRVSGLILTESAVIGLIGAGAGGTLGIVFILAVAAVLKQRLGIIIDTTPDLRLTLPTLAAAVLLSILAGLAPATLAYRTAVIRNLRPAA